MKMTILTEVSSNKKRYCTVSKYNKKILSARYYGTNMSTVTLTNGMNLILKQ